MIKIGVTGGIGTGKSIVCKLLQTMGYPVFDTDLEAKLLMNGNQQLRLELIDCFGSEVYLDGALNRAYLASIIFSNPVALQSVNSIVHPYVRRGFAEWVAMQQVEIIFLESAILFESGLNGLLDYVWSVSAPLDLRVERVMARDQMARALILNRISAQMSQDKKDELADLVIFNDATHPLIPQVCKALESLNQ